MSGVSLKSILARLSPEYRDAVEAEAQRISDNTPRYGVYQHFKGGRYIVLGVSKHSETGELEVVYRSMDGELWHRPLENHPKAWLTPLPDGTPRFKRL